MRNEKRTFRHGPFRRWLSIAQVIWIVLGAVLWAFVRDFGFLGGMSTGEFFVYLLSVGVLSWICISAMQLLRYFLFKRLPDVPTDGVKIGFLWGRGGMVSCKCLAAIQKSRYIAVLLSSMILWPVLLIIGLVFGSFAAFAAGWLGFAAVLGDLAVLWRIIRIPKGSWVQDSPFEPGCEVYLPEQGGEE